MSCQTPSRCAIRSRRPTSRKPARRCSSRLGSFAAMIAVWIVQIPCSAAAATERVEQRAADAPTTRRGGDIDAVLDHAAVARGARTRVRPQPSRRDAVASATSRGAGRWAASHCCHDGTAVSNVATPVASPSRVDRRDRGQSPAVMGRMAITARTVRCRGAASCGPHPTVSTRRLRSCRRPTAPSTADRLDGGGAARGVGGDRPRA